MKDTSIASVDQKGTVTAIKPGTTEVIATADDKTASVKLTVRQRFTDVPPSALFASDIDWLTSVRITQGNSNGTYGYGQTLRRQDMAIFLYRFAKLQNIGSASTFKPSAKDYAKFKDVKKGSFAATEILWLASTGITQGNPDGTFRGTNTLTRQDMAIYLYRLAKLAGNKNALSFKPTEKDYAKFKDVKKGSFAATEILWLASTGITQGNPDGTFRGTNKLNRQDMAVFLHRMYTYLRKS